MGSSSCRSPIAAHTAMTSASASHIGLGPGEGIWSFLQARPVGHPARMSCRSRAAWACLRSRKPEQDGHAGASTARADITFRPVNLYRPHNLRSESCQGWNGAGQKTPGRPIRSRRERAVMATE